MIAFILRRFMATIPVLVMVAVVVFILVRLTPGDPAVFLAGDAATPESIEAIRKQLALDRPWIEQFGIWVGKLLQGDLGTSIISQVPVTELIATRLEPTITLATTTLLFTVIVAVPLGVIAAWKHDTTVDRLIMAFAVIGFSIPIFVLGYLLVWTFAVNVRWMPVQGFKPIGEGLWIFLRHITLPTLALSVIYIALIARITRASMLEILTEDYIRTAHAKGLSETKVLMRHALRNAAVPILTVIGLGIALLISGVVVTESVFNIPGLGRLTVDAVLARDYPTIQGMILMFSALYVFINLMIDVSYSLLDPRIRY